MTNLNRERKVGSSGSLAAWWTTSVAASFLLNLHHHHSLHHSWPSPGSERAKGGPALDFQLQITEISRNVDLRTSGTGRIYPVPIWSGLWLGFEPPAKISTPWIGANLKIQVPKSPSKTNRCSNAKRAVSHGDFSDVCVLLSGSQFPHGVRGGIDVGVLFLRILTHKGDRNSCVKPSTAGTTTVVFYGQDWGLPSTGIMEPMGC